MIYIQRLEYDESKNLIRLHVYTEAEFKITSIVAQDIYGTQTIDLSNKLSNSNKEVLEFNTDDLDLSQPLWIFRIKSNEEIYGNKLAVVGNLYKYHKCVLKKLLSITVKNCKIEYNQECDECNSLVLYAHTLLETLKDTIQYGLYDEAKKVIMTLDEICQDCTNCGDNSDIKLTEGISIGTFNNTITVL